jgi:hypothetical protein
MRKSPLMLGQALIYLCTRGPGVILKSRFEWHWGSRASPLTERRRHTEHFGAPIPLNF